MSPGGKDIHYIQGWAKKHRLARLRETTTLPQWSVGWLVLSKTTAFFALACISSFVNTALDKNTCPRLRELSLNLPRMVDWLSMGRLSRPVLCREILKNGQVFLNNAVCRVHRSKFSPSPPISSDSPASPLENLTTAGTTKATSVRKIQNPISTPYLTEWTNSGKLLGWLNNFLNFWF